MTRTILLLTSLFLLNPVITSAENEWPQFRGPNGNGDAGAADLPLKWSETENVTWKQPVPGEGFSSPVISGDQLWLTTAIVEPLSEEREEEKKAELATSPRGIQFGGPMTLKAICYDLKTGKVIHDVDCFKYPEANPKHATNSYASPTPVIRSGRLYCHFGEYGTCCLDTESGTIVWRNQSLKIDHQNGPGASPVLWKDKLICQYDGIDHQFVAAFDAETGEVAWKQQRSGELDPKPEFKKAYCTPTIVTVNGQDQVVSPGANWVYGYDPATGEELWKAGYGQLGFSTVPKPIIGNGMAFISTSFLKSRLVAVKYDGKGDVTETHVAWTADRQIPKKTSLLLIDDRIYCVGDGGISISLDAKTGELLWQERLRGQYSASPLFANGHIYAFNQEGQTTVFKPGDSLEILVENELEEGCMASPAVVGDALFVRTMSHLYRIEK